VRVCIGGGPRTGKTTTAKLCAGSLRHTDDLIDLGWHEASAQAAAWMTEPDPWVIEGVAVARALRKALAASPDAPCDVLVWMSAPYEPLTPGQASMAKGCETVLAEILPELRARGVTIVDRPPESVLGQRHSRQ
jgi:hypothetical protein